MSAGKPPRLEALTRFLGDNGLPKNLWPESVLSIGTLPRTAAGKIRKNKVRERMVDAGRGDALGDLETERETP